MVKCYSNGEMLFAMWTDGIAVDDDPGIETSLTIPGFSASQVVGIDVLYGLEQELVTVAEDGNLIISGLMIRDYPFLIRVSDTAQ